MSDYWHEHIIKWDWAAIGAVAAACATLLAALGLLVAARALKAATASNAIAARAHRGANIVCRKVDLARDYIESATKTIAQAHEFEPDVPVLADAPVAQVLFLKIRLGNVGNAPARHVEVLVTYGGDKVQAVAPAIPVLDERGGTSSETEVRVRLPASSLIAAGAEAQRLRPDIRLDCSWRDALGRHRERQWWEFEDRIGRDFLPRELPQERFNAADNYI